MEKNTPITVPALTCLATALLLSAALLGGCGLPADNAADPVDVYKRQDIGSL